jgi:hypothetical protein
MKPVFMTAFGARISSPIVVKTQESPKEKTITSDADCPGLWPVAERKPEDDDDGRAEEVAHAVPEHRADERGGPPDR